MQAALSLPPEGPLLLVAVLLLACCCTWGTAAALRALHRCCRRRCRRCLLRFGRYGTVMDADSPTSALLPRDGPLSDGKGGDDGFGGYGGGGVGYGPRLFKERPTAKEMCDALRAAFGAYKGRYKQVLIASAWARMAKEGHNGGGAWTRMVHPTRSDENGGAADEGDDGAVDLWSIRGGAKQTPAQRRKQQQQKEEDAAAARLQARHRGKLSRQRSTDLKTELAAKQKNRSSRRAGDPSRQPAAAAGSRWRSSRRQGRRHRSRQPSRPPKPVLKPAPPKPAPPKPAPPTSPKPGRPRRHRSRSR